MKTKIRLQIGWLLSDRFHLPTDGLKKKFPILNIISSMFEILKIFFNKKSFKKPVFLLLVFLLLVIPLFSVLAFSEQRKFIGQEHDDDTGLDYLNARYYNPNTGRFISQDPMFWDFSEDYLSDPQQWNSYSYARNNPIVGSDPSGESAELNIRPLTPIPGAHPNIIINTESGADLSQYGEGSRFSIGGYPSNWWGGKLQVKINESGDLNFPKSKYLATYPLIPPEGMTPAQYDQELLESASNRAKSDLGMYVFTGQPISPFPNSGNTATQVIIDAGGAVPAIQNIYIGPSPLPGPLHNLPYPYFPLGSGKHIGTPWFGQQLYTATRNYIDNKIQSTLNSVSSTFSQLNQVLKKANGN
ncbi:MAG: RHS repeat-associated core domain-containing protein [Candidatus Staskawiczbacteria bacterium]|nr:RHS repeat-associated core domain-containing protein [Candidatus Staskawiczbacteria bacterium]